MKRQIVAPGENFDPLKLGEGPFPLPVGQPAGEVLARFEVELLDKPSDDNLAARLAKVKTEGLLLRPRPATDLAREVERLELFYDTATLIPVGVLVLDRNGDRKTVALRDLAVNKGIDAGLLQVNEPNPAQWQIDVRPWRGE